MHAHSENTCVCSCAGSCPRLQCLQRQAVDMQLSHPPCSVPLQHTALTAAPAMETELWSFRP